MGTAIIINLDYETQAIARCRNLWAIIEARMLGAGFVKVNRRFVSQEDTDTACRQARTVIDGIEADFRAKGYGACDCIRDFYAVPHGMIVDLTAPVSHSIEVDMMSTGAFQKFFG